LHSEKRPKELPCEIHRVNVRAKDDSGDITTQTYIVLLGLLNGKPYEIFCGLSEHVDVPKKCKNGVLVKNGKKAGVATYNLRIPIGDDDDAIVLKDVVNLFENATYGAFTRILSLALRHEIPLQFVVEQLQKDKYSDMQSFSRVIARVLKHHILDGTPVSGEKKSGFLWSSKGKKIEKYFVSNKKIIISPKSMMKGIIPSILITGIIGFGIRYLSVDSVVVSQESMALADSSSKMAAPVANTGLQLAQNTGGDNQRGGSRGQRGGSGAGNRGGSRGINFESGIAGS
jgi:hypothetical protein